MTVAVCARPAAAISSRPRARGATPVEYENATLRRATTTTTTIGPAAVGDDAFVLRIVRAINTQTRRVTRRVCSVSYAWVGSRRPDENGEKNGRRRRQHVLTKATFRDRRIPKTSDKRRRRRRITVCGERQNFSPYSCGRRGAQEVPFPRVRRVYLGFAWNVWRDDHGDFWSNARIDFFFNDTSGRRFQHASRVV